jgi:phosphotransferase system HPr (HPr) family protein
MSISKQFKVTNKVGLHARPAAKFVKAAASLKHNSILIENLSKQTPQVNAKSFTSVLSISVQQNDEILVTIDGENADAAMQTLTELFETNFGEDE